MIDDEIQWLQSLKLALAQAELMSYEDIVTAQNAAEAYKLLCNENISLILLDIIMDNESGIDILKQIKSLYPDIPVVMMTGIGSIQTAVKCMDLGAEDYLVKTIPTKELTTSVNRILIRHLEGKSQTTTNADDDIDGFEDYITTSAEMRGIFKYLKSVAHSTEPILITGESGVGKGVLARCFADISRKGKPFVALDVSGVDPQMFSDVLFGHSKGAFTGAETMRQGAVAQAEDGILFLDEIGDIHQESQLKLLQLTQDRRFKQLGRDSSIECNSRLVFATNQNLAQKVSTGTFRKDLYYRISAHTINIPPLRNRKEDIRLLIDHFLKKASESFKKDIPKIDNNMLLLLKSYDYPGNVRQLRAMIYDMVARCETNVISMKDLKIDIRDDLNDKMPAITSASSTAIPRLENVIDNLISKALDVTGGNQSKASAMLGLSQSTISRRLKRLNK